MIKMLCSPQYISLTDRHYRAFVNVDVLQAELAQEADVIKFLDGLKSNEVAETPKDEMTLSEVREAATSRCLSVWCCRSVDTSISAGRYAHAKIGRGDVALRACK